MKSRINSIILFCCILLLVFAIPAGAAVPRLFEVRDNIAEPERTELKARKAQLLSEKEALKSSVDAYNSRCRDVRETSPDAYECKMNHSVLDINVNNYAVSVHKFNRAVLNAPRATKKPAPAPKVIKKPAPAPKVVKKPVPVPAPKVVKKPAPAPAPKVVKKPAPAPAPKVVKKPAPAPAPKVIKKPAPAPAPKVIKKPAPTPKALKKSIPAIRITNINEYLIIAMSKTSDAQIDNSNTLDKLVKTAKASAANTSKMKKFNKVQQEIYKRRAVSLKQINKFSRRHMSEEMERLKQEGYYNSGDDLMEKERNEPHFRDAVQQVLELRYEAERDVHKRALEEIRAALSELRGE